MFSAYPELDPQGLCDLPAGSFVLSGNGATHDGHGNVGNDFLNPAGVVDNGVKGLNAESWMAESQIFLGTFCVQTDGDCIDDTAEILRCIALIDEVAEAVGVYTDLDAGAEFLCEAGGLQKVAEPFGRFAVTAEDQLISSRVGSRLSHKESASPKAPTISRMQNSHLQGHLLVRLA